MAKKELDVRHDLISTLLRWKFIKPEFEAFLERHYSKWIKPGETIIDIGAHRGRHLQPMLQLVGDNGSGVAFEPLPFFFEKLQQKFTSKNVSIHNVALSNATGVVDFTYAQGAPAESGLKARVFNNPEVANPTIIKVKTAKLDDYTREMIKLSYIKIDVEGGEIGCLQGATETLARLRPVVSVEYGRLGYSAYGNTQDTLFDFAAQHGYRLYDIFLNKLAERAEWHAGCDSFCWDYFMVPLELETEFENRLR